jgi:hypothetical protein
MAIGWFGHRKAAHTAPDEILRQVQRLRCSPVEAQLPQEAGEAFGEALTLLDERKQSTPKTGPFYDQRRLRHQERIDVIEIEARADGDLNQCEASCTDGVRATKVVEQLAAPIQ